MRRVLSIVGVVCLMSLSAWGASIQLQHQATFTLPWSTSALSYMELGDATGDGFPEVAVWTSSNQIAVYSLTGDSLLLVQTPDISRKVGAVSYGDVTGDGLFDLVTISWSPDSLWPKRTCYFQLLDAARGFACTAIDSILTPGSSNYSSIPPRGGRINLVQFDGDPAKEILFTIDTAHYDDALGNEALYPITRLYRHFPDTVGWTRTYALAWVTGFTDLSLGNMVVGGYFSYYSSWFHTFAQEWAITRPERVRDDGGLRNYAVPAWYEWDCPYTNKSRTWITLYPVCSGKIDATRANSTILFQYEWTESCGNITPHDVDSGGEGYALFEFVSTDSLQRVWISPDMSEISVGLYDDAFPGHFLAILQNQLSLFRGSDGAVLSQTAPLESGKYSWTSTFPDGRPRLIRQSGSNLSVYRLDVSTSVEDNSPDALPMSFALGAPYPNPFNGSIVLPVNNDRRQRVKIDVVNMLGQKVATVYDDELGAGEQTITWNAGDRPSGVYLVRATSDTGGDTRKVVYLK